MNVMSLLVIWLDHEADRARQLSAAVAEGLSKTCDVCLSEVLPDDLVSCHDGHQYCHECVISAAEVAVESGSSQVLCLHLECRHEYPRWLIATLLPPRLKEILDRRHVEEDVIKLANDIEDLVVCPFCPFAMVMPNKLDKVFHCRNPECMRTSCRSVMYSVFEY